jgi:hypothetical protein
MNPFLKPFRHAAYATLLAASQLSFALMPTGAPAPTRAGPSDLIERGGTVQKVDMKNQTLVVDGTSYAIPAGSVRVHALTGVQPASLADLKPGTQIRFSSVQPYASSAIQVREIWISGLARR